MTTIRLVPNAAFGSVDDEGSEAAGGAVRPGTPTSGLGLDIEPERVYRALLSRRRWQRAELGRCCAIEMTRLHAILDQLRASGLVLDSRDESDAVRAVEPAVALPGLAADAIVSGAGQPVSAAAVRRFVAWHEAGDRRFETEGELLACDDANAMVERMVAHAQHDIIFLAPYFVADAPHFSRPILDAATRRGLTVQAVWGGRVSGHSDAWKHGERLAAAGFGPRVAASVPVSAVIIDSDAAVVIPDAGRPRVVRAGAELRTLLDLAGRVLTTATPITALAQQAQLADDVPRCQLVLRLLAQGCTDDTMARRLGCSVRTIRNEVATAMVTLDARSRFQAGVYAVKAGLI